MGSADASSLDDPLEGANAIRDGAGTQSRFRFSGWLVLGIALLIFGSCALSPPSLMDDVDAVQAQIARNMLDSGDWVTARLDGVKYLEKSPLWYWLIAICFRIFGVHDWAARIPVVLSALFLCWITYRIGRWAFSNEAGVYAGVVIASCVGMFLFTRILIPDVCVTAFIALSLWAFLRALDPEETQPRAWAYTCFAGIAVGMLLKGLIAAVFPVGIALTYLLLTGQFHNRSMWRRLHLWTGSLIALAIATPWHIIATLRNPPYFAATLHSGPGEYKGFFWFYFINEHLLRFLNLRYPRDYNTVPRLWFWLLHLVWLFPWSVFLPGVLRLRYRPLDRAGRVRLLALLWIGFVLLFFTFSTTQEYYSMPCYPAFALLIGCVLTELPSVRRWSLRSAVALCALGCAATLALLIASRNFPTPGDISHALIQHPSAYTLSLGHMGDLTIASFAYLRLPLAMATAAFLVGGLGPVLLRGPAKYFSLAVAMILLLQAAHVAMIAFDPYLSSRPLAKALLTAPPGTVILDDQYYTFSSVVFYTNRQVLLLNGRVNNLEYGANAPDAPHVFIDDAGLQHLWTQPRRCYLFLEAPAVPRLASVLGREQMYAIAESGGKYLYSNSGVNVRIPR